MHLIQGFFVQGLPGLEIGHQPEMGESVLIRHHVASVMFAGTIGVDEAGIPSGYVFDKLGEAILERITFSDDRLEFVKHYLHNGHPSRQGIVYDLRLVEGNLWSGTYSIPSSGEAFKGTVECIITEFDDDLLNVSIKRFSEMHQLSVVKKRLETNEDFADRLIDETRSTPLQF